MRDIVTKHGTFNLAQAAYGAGCKLGSSSVTNDEERITREGIYRYFTDHPDDLVFLINVGFLTPVDVGNVVPSAR
jgi:hypothetical protein